MSDGNGLQNLYPALTTKEFAETFASSFACIVRDGLSDTIVVNDVKFDIPMEGIPELTEAEIANLYNYIVYEWHPDLDRISEQDVGEMIKKCSSSKD